MALPTARMRSIWPERASACVPLQPTLTITRCARASRYAHARGVKVLSHGQYHAVQPRPAGALRPISELLAGRGRGRAHRRGRRRASAWRAGTRPTCRCTSRPRPASLNHEAANYWADAGPPSVSCSRASCPSTRSPEYRAKTPKELEIEAFVHGAMCISYSGRCLISQYMTGRDANHGACAQPCRWNYTLMEEAASGRVLPGRGGRDAAPTCITPRICA